MFFSFFSTMLNPKKWICLTAILICAVHFTRAQDFQQMMADAERTENIPNEKLALAKFQEALKIQPHNLTALSKCSELASRIGAREKDTHKRDRYYETAIAYARTAYKYYQHTDLANVAMAIAIGRSVLTKSGKEKIAYVKDIKSYAEKAIQLNPNNFKAWHIIGKWHYEVSNLTFIEKTATKIFFGGLPASSFKASIAAYEKAKSLEPYFCLNYLELAKSFYKNDQPKKAIATLKQLLTLSGHTEDDPRIKAEAIELLKNWE